MNAPTAPELATPSIQTLPIAAIVPSKTHIQELRRARFTKESLEELAASIRRVGVLQPIVTRPAGLANQYELVAGERRWLAAKQAGLTEIRASVCVLTPEQVLEVQLIENLQREGLHELEEAEGYEELMQLKKINAEALAALVKKSRSYVYGRLKLLALCPEARKAFYAGELDGSRALLVARIGHHDTQRQAMKDLAGTKWEGPLSYREAHRHILEHYTLKLKAAPFPAEDAALLPKAGACSACPKRTGNQRDLFSDVKDPDVCTDPKCYADKRAASIERRRAAAVKAGQKVITGKDARAIFPHDWREEASGGYASLDAVCWDDPKHRKVREVLAKHPELVELVQHPKSGDLVEVARSSAVTEVLNERGIKTHRQKVAQATAKSRQSNAATKAEKELEDKIARQQAIAIFKAAPAKISKPMLMQLFERRLNDYDFEADEDLGAMLGLEPGGMERTSTTAILKKLESLSEADLTRAYVAMLICEARFGYDKRQEKTALGWVKVDLKKIDAAVRAEAKAAAAKAAKPAAKPKKKSKR